MFYNIYTYRLVIIFGLLVSFQCCYSQSESQLYKKSNSFFSKEDYRNAVNGFRQLLSNDITNIDYNYKYAVCLFYTKSPKSSQKYFDYLLNQEGFPIEVFYFKGRLYHLNYQFDQAIEMYEDYEKIKTSKDKDFQCLDEIKRCQNAKSLLKSPRAIEVISMQKISKENYFSSYVFDSENYKLYSNSDVFSKVNQKKGFVPKYVFKRGMKYRFFSSYSKLENAQKDLFIQQKDADNEWKEPVRLGVEINSSFNEDFPFFDENTGYLYFSSDGHSSIGGMDVFRVRFNLKNLTFGTIENLNFPYSSTYDDFLYIPIESASYAYFSTNRNSDVGSVEVVKSKLSDREVPTFVSRLMFRDEIDNENNSAQFYLTNRNSKDKFGPFNTNDSGFVNILIPAPGIYKLTAIVEGNDQEFSEEINFPPKVKGYDYQVECLHKLLDSKKVLLFDEQLTDQSSLLADVNVVDFQEISKLIVNSESIKANEEIEKNNEVSEMSQEEIDAKIDELYDIEAEIEDQKRQKNQVAKNLIKAKVTLASLDKKINRIVENIETADSREKESLQKELRDSFVKRKALIDNFDKQIELYDKFSSDDELQENYNEITAINKKISEKSFNGQIDSVRSILREYNTPENYQPLIPSAPDIARARQDKMEDEFKTKEVSIDLLKSEISEDKKSVSLLKEQLSDVTSVQEWEYLTDSIIKIESNISNKIKDKQSLELEREELSEKIIFAEESLLNLTLIETETNDEDTINLADISINEEDKAKFYADEIYLKKVIEEQEKLVSVSEKRKENLSQILSTNLPIQIKDSLRLITENEFIEDINLQVNERFSESNDELNELIQLSQSNIEEIVEKNENLAIINTAGIETVEEENATEFNNTASENREEIVTSTSGEERSEETKSNDISNEESDPLIQGNSKSVEYLTSLVLEESMGDESKDKSNDIEGIVMNENDLKQYFKKELDIAIANEKIENIYLELKSKFPNVKFEGKNNIEAQLRELKIKESDLEMRLQSASSNNVKSLIAKLIDANQSKMELLVLELEELEELDTEIINIESKETTENNKSEIQRTNAYYKYVLDRDVIENENELLEELLIRNEDAMLSLDQSLRTSMNRNELAREQDEKINELAKIQEAIAYLKESIELNKSNISQDENARSYEFLYQNKVNPVVDVNTVKNIENNTKQINDLTNELSVSLKTSKESIQNISPNTDGFIAYVEKRTLLNLKLEELDQLTSNGDSSRNKEENSVSEGYLYVNEVKKEKISKEIISLVNEMNSSDSSDLFESYINNKISFESLASSDRVNQSILDLLPPNNSERNSFVVLEAEVVVQNKQTLPILESNPSGLNFRVQVGAFRRPVREDVYREFTPVSGQQLNNGLIVYMAGYFNNSIDAVSAQKSIRSIGYSDAFIVSYCNDERLPFWKGKEYERSGKCLASNRNEPIALNTSNESVETNVNNNARTNETENSTSNAAESSIAANENIFTPSSKVEQHGDNLVRTIDVKGLFYSVQVGAFNRKIRGNELSQLKELNYYRATGLYRYSSGKFDSIEKAKERQKDVISLGISDAFIVAYYNGERISIQKSRNLLIENGNAILFENDIQSDAILSNAINESNENKQFVKGGEGQIQISKPIEIPIIREEEVPKKVKMVSYSFNTDSFDQGTIERLNRIGVFHYHEEDAIIKSCIINKSELTPIMLFYMKGMEEQEYETNELLHFSIELGTRIPGRLANWLLRTNKTFSFIVLNGVNHLKFYLNNEMEKTELRDELNQLLK